MLVFLNVTLSLHLCFEVVCTLSAHDLIVLRYQGVCQVVLFILFVAQVKEQISWFGDAAQGFDI